MIAYIKGSLATAGAGWAIIETHGIGYHLQIPLTTPMPGRGQEIKLHTYMAVREDGIQLYGFAAEEQRDCFLALLDVAGVGPKVALAVLSTLSPNQLRGVIIDNDVNQLVKVPGVGKKTAQRIILELKDKLKASLAGPVDYVPEVPTQGAIGDALAALVALGYSPSEAREAVTKAQSKDAQQDVSALIKLALKELTPLK
ncbi:Holliday junction branch migration protein RuvA [Desulforamulus ferrireducens]|uniref:Holliday junction branch migration complex subunit RuvA n=1 Tax=Desulforamulus ferrireducens TaxID=1833852 RepID=A0A1S6IW69_9FIRM|nr:Holliday junction branch migration protein RuvA [Desulforamulus ferrireducens]AQS59009.1 Holliday junction branch migration protein RuvA [Desulforamulus ferrireducens]